MPSFGFYRCERNRRVFDGVESSQRLLKEKWLKTLFFWKEEPFCFSSFDVVDFVESLFLGL